MSTVSGMIHTCTYIYSMSFNVHVVLKLDSISILAVSQSTGEMFTQILSQPQSYAILLRTSGLIREGYSSSGSKRLNIRDILPNPVSYLLSDGHEAS